MNILIINGPNLNMLGIREPDVYGTETLDDLEKLIKKERGEKHQISFFQSNHEGEIIDAIHRAYFEKFDGIVINPGAYTHTSIAIMDALKSVPIPSVEVHISDPMQREDFRKTSYTSLAVIKTIKGHGFNGYIEAIDLLDSVSL